MQDKLFFERKVTFLSTIEISFIDCKDYFQYDDNSEFLLIEIYIYPIRNFANINKNLFAKSFILSKNGIIKIIK